MGSEKYILLDFEEQQSCQCLDQISGRREFVLNLLQKCSIEKCFW